MESAPCPNQADSAFGYSPSNEYINRRDNNGVVTNSQISINNGVEENENDDAAT